MTRIARYWRAQPLYLTLLFAALVMRGLIPAGYMPAPGHGLFALELCTAQQYRMPGAGPDGTVARSDAPLGTAHVQGHVDHVPTGSGQQHNVWFLGTPAEQHGEARSGSATAHHHHDVATEQGSAHQHEPSSLVASEQPHGQRAPSSLGTSEQYHQHALASLGESAEPHHQHNGATTPGHDSPCPFAATAVCAPAPTIVSHAVAIETLAVLASREPQVSTPSLLARSQSARAPPALS